MFFRIIIISLLVFSCKKAENRSCFKSSGTTANITVHLEDFTEMRLEKNIEYILVQDSVNKLVITGGINLISFIEWQIENNLLTISNKNKCNFLRDLKHKVKVEIHFNKAFKVDYYGSEKITCKDTIRQSYFDFTMIDNSSSAELLFNGDFIRVDATEGASDFNVAGKTINAYISCRTNSIGNTRNLSVSNELFARNISQGELKINAQNTAILKGYILGVGNIKYTGTPQNIAVELLGEGQLIAE